MPPNGATAPPKPSAAHAKREAARRRADPVTRTSSAPSRRCVRASARARPRSARCTTWAWRGVSKEVADRSAAEVCDAIEGSRVRGGRAAVRQGPSTVSSIMRGEECTTLRLYA
ncbi:hypothetical protein AB1Y20_016920 [Prymnesium parvum]|uniref:Uncharacterized protein n=1 Tax=Prymnesium parvum TaxID=97485 RepID=A0AB34IB87_PRYPA